MGEYATLISTEQRIKIGTCENLTDLRADQIDQVTANYSIHAAAVAGHVRFRFPFPDEDAVRPGGFEDYDRAWKAYGIKLDTLFPDGADHGTVQFTSNYPQGYIVSLPCPEGPNALTRDGGQPLVGKNGWQGGDLGVVQQRVWEGALATVVECPGCGNRFRLETLADAEPLIAAIRAQAEANAAEATRANNRADSWGEGIRAEAERNDALAARRRADHLNTLADRIADGYINPPAWVASATTSVA